MIRLAAHSHYFERVPDGAALPALDDALNACCREPFRRIDRFIQLALIGSARCAAGHALRPDCALYLGSGLGPIGNTLVTQEQMLRQHEMPKPFNFINTLGASAGYYVARNLGSSGQNWFVSRRSASLEAVLETAYADFMHGTIRQALLGVVEEVALPLDAQRRRQGLADGCALAEGSHWLLLEADAASGRTFHCKRFGDLSALRAALASAWRQDDTLLCATDMAPEAAADLRRAFPGTPLLTAAQGFHDSLAAAQLTAALAAGETGGVCLVGGDTVRGWRLFHFRA